MREWLYYQFDHFNLLSLIVIVIYVTFMGKANTQKLLKEQSQELYKWHEELKDEIRGNSKR